MCANFEFDVQLWNWFFVMNSYSTLQVCMKFVYIATGLVFLLSYWISDNVYNQLIRISQTQLELLKDGACQLLLNTAAKKPIHTLFVIPKEIDIATLFSFAIMNDNRLLYYYCCMIKLAIVILWHWWVAQEN